MHDHWPLQYTMPTYIIPLQYAIPIIRIFSIHFLTQVLQIHLYSTILEFIQIWIQLLSLYFKVEIMTK